MAPSDLLWVARLQGKELLVQVMWHTFTPGLEESPAHVKERPQRQRLTTQVWMEPLHHTGTAMLVLHTLGAPMEVPEELKGLNEHALVVAQPHECLKGLCCWIFNITRLISESFKVCAHISYGKLPRMFIASIKELLSRVASSNVAALKHTRCQRSS